MTKDEIAMREVLDEIDRLLRIAIYAGMRMRLHREAGNMRLSHEVRSFAVELAAGGKGSKFYGVGGSFMVARQLLKTIYPNPETGGQMIIYEGIRGVPGAHCVWHEAESVQDAGTWFELPLRLDLANHSPTGFEWGYRGSGPAQLALALLAHALGDDERALRLHQQFKFRLIAGLPSGEGWVISQNIVRLIADQIERPLTKNA